MEFQNIYIQIGNKIFNILFSGLHIGYQSFLRGLKKIIKYSFHNFKHIVWLAIEIFSESIFSTVYSVKHKIWQCEIKLKVLLPLTRVKW